MGRSSAVAIMTVAMLAASAGAQGADTTIRIGAVRTISNGSMLIAVERGYFKEYGIKIEVEDFDSSANAMALLAQNRYQIVAGGISAGYFNAVEKNLPVAIAASRVNSPIRHNLMLRPDLKGTITSSAQLKGKVIASNGPGSVSTYEVGKMLELAGLSIADVDVKILPFTQMPIAFANKAIDAAIVIPPFTAQFQDLGHAVPFLDADELVKPSPISISVNFINTDWAKANPELVRNYYTAYLRGVRDYCQAYHGGAVRKQMIDLLVSSGAERREELLNKYPWPARDPDGRLNVASMIDMQDWFVKNKYAAARHPAERLVDLSFVEYAARKLGPFVLENPESKLPGCR